jgi:hypothetical protein
MTATDTGSYAGTLKACYERAVAKGETKRAEILKAAYTKERARMEAARPVDGLR